MAGIQNPASPYSDLEVVPPGEGIERSPSGVHAKLTDTKGINPAHSHLYPEVLPDDGLHLAPDKGRVTPAAENEKTGLRRGRGGRLLTWQMSGSRGEDSYTNTPLICGIRRRRFWAYLIIAVLLVVIAIVLGVALGVRGRHQGNTNDSSSAAANIISSTTSSSIASTTPKPTSSSSSSTSSTSTTTAQDAYPTTSLGLNCPALNGTSATIHPSSTTSQNFTFNIFCNANFGAGVDSSVKNTSSLNDCMQSCADLVSEGATCVGVVWDSVMNLALSPPKNCFMKGTTSGFGYTGNMNISAAGLVVGK